MFFKIDFRLMVRNGNFAGMKLSCHGDKFGWSRHKGY